MPCKRNRPASMIRQPRAQVPPPSARVSPQLAGKRQVPPLAPHTTFRATQHSDVPTVPTVPRKGARATKTNANGGSGGSLSADLKRKSGASPQSKPRPKRSNIWISPPRHAESDSPMAGRAAVPSAGEKHHYGLCNPKWVFASCRPERHLGTAHGGHKARVGQRLFLFWFLISLLPQIACFCVTQFTVCARGSRRTYFFFGTNQSRWHPLLLDRQ
jgi:hypothetical protein